MHGPTDTAYQSWEETWKTGEGRAGWQDPDQFVNDCAGRLARQGRLRALDVGCGIGRHSLMLAGLGFDVVSIDGSEAGLASLRAAASAAGLAIDARQALMTALPFDGASFDYVLAFNVLYHGDGGVVRAAHEEICRVLRPGGTYQGTMLSTRHELYGQGDEISAGTFVIPGATDDKIHPHYYCDAAGLIAMIAPLQPLTLFDGEQKRPGNWHWHVTAQKPL